MRLIVIIRERILVRTGTVKESHGVEEVKRRHSRHW